MGLATAQRSGAALLKWRIDIKARGAKIVTGHGEVFRPNVGAEMSYPPRILS